MPPIIAQAGWQPAAQAAATTVVPSVVLPTLGVGDATAVEGEELVFTARLSAASETPVTVNYQTANGTATNGDYTSARGTLTFSAGETQKQITVHTTADAVQEGDEHVWLVLSKPQGATLADAWSTGAIIDNDRLPTINVSNLLGPADGGRFVVSLSNPYEQTVSVDYVLSSARGNSTQHTSETAGTLTFAPGETLLSVPVASTLDAAGDSRASLQLAQDELQTRPTISRVTLSLSNAGNATIARSESSGTFVPAAAPPASSQPAPWDSAAGDSAGAMFLSGGSPTLTVEGGSCLEGGWLGFSVTISDANPTEPVTVCFSTADGTARSEYDYSYTSGELIFYGAGTQYVSVPTIDDEVYEGDETFSLVLYNEVLGTYWATGTLFDGESPPTISIDGDSATEGGESTLDFLVTISGPTDVSTSVEWATRDGSATSEDNGSILHDYVADSDYVFFEHYPGQWDPCRWISVELCNDLHYDGGTEEFYVDLSNPIGATLAGNGTAAGTIYDNDPLPLLALAPATCSEAAGQMVFTLMLSNANQSEVQVSWQTADLDPGAGLAPATAGADYASTLGMATFSPGQTETTVAIPILDDSYCEPDEGFLLRVTGASGCTFEPTYPYPTAVGRIEDDDIPVVTIAATTPDAYEENTVGGQFTVTRSEVTSDPLIVYLDIGGWATNVSDYAEIPDSVTIAGGSASVTIAVVPVDDQESEGPETVEVALLESAEYALDYEAYAAVVMIHDNELVVDLDADSDNDGALARDRIEDGMEDAPSAGEYLSTLTGARRAEIALELTYPPGGLSGATATLWTPANPAGLTVWDAPEGGNPVDLGEPYDLDTQTLPSVLYVQAASAGVSTLKLTVTGPSYEQLGEDTIVFTSLAEQIVDLQIWNGQYKAGDRNADGNTPSGSGFDAEALEWKVGAFTVVNTNDTDGDGRIDTDDSEVRMAFCLLVGEQGAQGSTTLTSPLLPGRFQQGDEIRIDGAQGTDRYVFRKIVSINAETNTITLDAALDADYRGGWIRHRGREEVDLMKLLITKPKPAAGGNIVLSVNTDKVKLWKEPTKGADKGVPLFWNGVTGKWEATFAVSTIEVTGMPLWVEVVGKSLTVRDFEFQLSYNGASDWVRATGVWAEFNTARHDNPDQPWPNTGIDRPLDTLGLRPRAGDQFRNVILMEWVVGPLGIADESNVKFSVGRQREFKYWYYRGGGWMEGDVERIPKWTEYANDRGRGSEGDESPSPRSEYPHVYYTSDGPAVGSLAAPPVGTLLVRRDNFNEWLRVSFDGKRRMGNGLAAMGSRVSDIYEWHCVHSIEFAAQGWKRTTGDTDERADNEIAGGHIDVNAHPA